MDDAGESRKLSKVALAGVVATSAIEFWLRELAVFAAVLLSLIVAIAGVDSGHSVWLPIGLSTGIAGMGLPFWALGRSWSIGRTWLLLLVILTVNTVVMLWIWQS